MFFGSIVAVLGTALCTSAVSGKHREAWHIHSYADLGNTAGMFIVGRLLLGIGGVVVGAIGPVCHTKEHIMISS
jgi:hypothetical protein